jgi:hypothetical protein
MEHSEAIETMAAERYALGEMTPEERDLFEEHYFDCSVCSQSVRDGAAIAAGSRAAATTTTTTTIATAPAAAAPLRRRNTWLPAAVAAALVAVVGYQNFVTIPHLRGAAAPAIRIAHPVSLLMAETRGGSVAPVDVARDEDVQFYFDVPPETPYPSYIAEVRDAAGTVLATQPISAAEARETVSIIIRAGVVGAGNGEVVVSGTDAAKRKLPLAHYPFEVRFR